MSSAISTASPACSQPSAAASSATPTQNSEDKVFQVALTALQKDFGAIIPRDNIRTIEDIRRFREREKRIDDFALLSLPYDEKQIEIHLDEQGMLSWRPKTENQEEYLREMVQNFKAVMERIDKTYAEIVASQNPEGEKRLWRLTMDKIHLEKNIILPNLKRTTSFTLPSPSSRTVSTPVSNIEERVFQAALRALQDEFGKIVESDGIRTVEDIIHFRRQNRDLMNIVDYKKQPFVDETGSLTLQPKSENQREYLQTLQKNIQALYKRHQAIMDEFHTTPLNEIGPLQDQRDRLIRLRSLNLYRYRLEQMIGRYYYALPFDMFAFRKEKSTLAELNDKKVHLGFWTIFTNGQHILVECSGKFELLNSKEDEIRYRRPNGLFGQVQILIERRDGNNPERLARFSLARAWEDGGAIFDHSYFGSVTSVRNRRLLVGWGKGGQIEDYLGKDQEGKRPVIDLILALLKRTLEGGSETRLDFNPISCVSKKEQEEIFRAAGFSVIQGESFPHEYFFRLDIKPRSPTFMPDIILPRLFHKNFYECEDQEMEKEKKLRGMLGLMNSGF